MVLFLCFGVAQAQPSVAPGGVLNGASFIKGQPVSPGSIVSVFGTNLSSGLQIADSVPLSTSLGGVTVTLNDVTAPLYFVSSGQINSQVPYEVQPGTVNVVIQNGTSSDPVAFDLAVAAPGVSVSRPALATESSSIWTARSPRQAGPFRLSNPSGEGG